jgi:hypothetical protein
LALLPRTTFAATRRLCALPGSAERAAAAVLVRREVHCGRPISFPLNYTNMLPVGQQLWLKELESYIEFPPLQDPASYNLVQVLEQVKKMGERQPSK